MSKKALSVAEHKQRVLSADENAGSNLSVHTQT